jgi:hypothetical protein
MLYRALIGIVPMILVALFVTGAIPLSSVVPSGEYRSPVVQAEERTSGIRSAGQLPDAAVTPGQVHQVFEGVDASLDAEIKRRAPEEKKREERLRRERLGTWAPKGGGWGQ